MLTKIGAIAFSLLASPAVFAGPKHGQSAKMQVVSTKTGIHGSTSKTFTATDAIWARVGDRKVMYACAERGDTCPLIRPGKNYDVNQDGKLIYISVDSPDEKRPWSAKYKEVGTW
jgi:hypothetical protein